jgi:uncharacterized protein YegL
MSHPGGEINKRPLHFIWIADCSYSMQGEKIDALNTAIREALPAMRDKAQENPHAEVLLRAVKFSGSAEWHVEQATPVEQFAWKNLRVESSTSMGAAMKFVADALDLSAMEKRAYPPVLVLITDGMPTDEFDAGLNALMSQPWGKKAVRLGIAIGQDADHGPLKQFIGHSEIPVLQANNPEALTQFIRWASTEVLAQASSPTSQVAANGVTTTSNVDLPNAPQVSENDVW